ncbi:MAG: iron ABC transporter permease [Planctomycetota bacterium]
MRITGLFNENRLWVALGVATTLVVLLPLAAVVAGAMSGTDDAWDHVTSTLLPRYATGTLLLVSMTAVLASLIGVSAAWAVTVYRFPGRRTLAWALLLPLALPPYLVAYALTDLMDFGGPIHELVHGTLIGESWPRSGIRSAYGAVLVLTLSLYPYVYVAARQSFIATAFYTRSVARSLGRGPLYSFFVIALPLAAPAVIGGTLLVVMETAGDFGVADYFAVDTLSTGVYRAWLSLDSTVSAARISVLLLLGVIAFAATAGAIRRRTATPFSAASHPVPPTPLGPLAGGLVSTLCAAPPAMGFLVPLLLFVVQAADTNRGVLLSATRGTATLALISATVALVLGVVHAYAHRLSRQRRTRLAMSIALLGYGIPGTVISVGLLGPLSMLDHVLSASGVSQLIGGDSSALLLTGSLFAVVLGCQTRFLAISATTVRASFQRVRRSFDEAARTLGNGATRTLLRVHLPLTHRGVAIAGLLVFIDVCKELPMTLLLRPFNFETLAVRVYQLASDERLEEASGAALVLAAVGVAPVLLLVRLIQDQPSGESNAPKAATHA